MAKPFSKPVKMAPSQMESAELNDDSLWEQHPERALALAHETAELLVRGGAGGADNPIPERLQAFIDEEGLDSLAELWAPAEASSLPGALWRLVVMRHHLQERSDVVADLVERGLQRLATIDPVVAGVVEPVSAEGVLALLEDLFTGSFRGELAPALHRASALARLVSAGLLDWPENPATETDLTLSALHWDELSRSLAVSAKREEKGELF